MQRDNDLVVIPLALLLSPVPLQVPASLSTGPYRGSKSQVHREFSCHR